ncbi:heterokaryon incompatibility protein-domain-containing protein [Cladorrhinum sp. PSN332]|nr:heterokaryon incompatibility protein-domain-containing protein [Cladorrhinum sp. PSN332]
MNKEPYVYEPLPNDGDSIRLLHLFPSPGHAAPLRGTLHRTKLSKLQADLIDKYTALSYVWGDASQTSIIYIDDKEIVITASLDTALRDLRDARRVFHVWADALCINQQSTPERSFQVAMMDSIYSNANHTVVYLSSTPTPEETAFLDLALRRSEDPDEISAISSAAHQSRILDKPWFHRTWIFQELILSKDPWVQMGRRRAKWADFLFLSLWDGQQQQPNAVSPDQLMLAGMDRATEENKRRLLDLLKSRRGMGVTDPRDVVFAHLGIATPDDWKPFFQVDYSKTLGEVYTSVARYIASTYSQSDKNRTRHYGGSKGGINGFEMLLDNMENRDLESRRQDLPSWAPDWSLPKRAKTWYYNWHGLRDWRFPNGLPVMPDDVPVMISVGFGFGTIESLGPEAPLLKERCEPKEGRRKTRFHHDYIKALEDLREGIYKLGVGDLTPGHDVLESLRGFQHRQQVAELQVFVDECSRWLTLHPPVLKRSEWGTVLEEHTWNSWKMWGEQARQLDLPGCRLAVTSTGRLGSVPVQARAGDMCAAVVPFCDALVLRAVPGAPKGSKLEQQTEKHARDAVELSKGVEMITGWESQYGKLEWPGEIPLGTVGHLTSQCKIVGQAQFQDIHWGYFYQRGKADTEKKFGPELFILH